jgi:hypothetical protein
VRPSTERASSRIGRGVCGSCDGRTVPAIAPCFTPHLPLERWVRQIPKHLRCFLQQESATAGVVLPIVLWTVETALCPASLGGGPTRDSALLLCWTEKPSPVARQPLADVSARLPQSASVGYC